MKFIKVKVIINSVMRNAYINSDNITMIIETGENTCQIYTDTGEGVRAIESVEKIMEKIFGEQEDTGKLEEEKEVHIIR